MARTIDAQPSASRELLDVKSEQDYCWMRTNKTSSPTSLTVTLQR